MILWDLIKTKESREIWFNISDTWTHIDEEEPSFGGLLKGQKSKSLINVFEWEKSKNYYKPKKKSTGKTFMIEIRKKIN